MLVTTAEPFALQESARVAREIRHIDQAFRFSEIVLNRAVANEEGCSRCNDSRLTSSRAIAFLRQHFQGCPIRLAPDPGSPVLSARMLLQLGETVFGGRRRRLRPLPAPRVAAPKLSAAHWPAADHNLIAFVGKGGVGKTTIAAATAVNVRKSSTNAKVAICSTDPAPSLDDVFEQQVGNELAPALDDDNLLAAEIDAAAEFHTWATRMKQSLPGALTKNSGGIHVDLSYERRLFEALLDIVPPGLDEVFGVLRISKLLRHPAAPRNRQFHLILDMAPTGHALELLRTPDRILHWSRLLLKSLAPHRKLPFARDIGAEIAAFASDVRWLSKSLRDPQKFAAWVVLLAEPLPDRETERLLHQLRELQVPIAGIIINRVLLGERERTCARCRRIAAWQAATLQRFAKIAGAPARVFVVPEQARPPRGKHDLRTLTSKLRRLA
jgi:arsenite-transporting ATPase